jgi:hypothetical protein
MSRRLYGRSFAVQGVAQGRGNCDITYQRADRLEGCRRLKRCCKNSTVVGRQLTNLGFVQQCEKAQLLRGNCLSWSLMRSRLQLNQR